METLLILYGLVAITFILAGIADQEPDFVVVGLIWPILAGLILGRCMFILLRDGGKKALTLIFQVAKGDL